jgi:broad specificity phosphatase PhoE
MIRHGQTNVNHLRKIQGRREIPLNDTGRKQAADTANYLKNNDSNWDFIYSSPLSRAFETASIIKNTINFEKDIIIEDSFIERDFGDADGMDITDEIFKYIIADDVPNLEKSFEIQKRVSDGILKVCEKHPNKKILIVAHSHTIKALLTFCDKQRTFLDTLYNCSMTYFTVDNNIISIDRTNIMPNN